MMLFTSSRISCATAGFESSKVMAHTSADVVASCEANRKSIKAVATSSRFLKPCTMPSTTAACAIDGSFTGKAVGVPVDGVGIGGLHAFENVVKGTPRLATQLDVLPAVAGLLL
eukprot:scaffold266_cov391-Prasinococcus_capsulatus_cf.AAC.26